MKEASPTENQDVAAAALTAVARRRCGDRSASAVAQARREFSVAFGEFPFHIGVVYGALLQKGPSNLLWAEPTNYRGTMVGFPYDDLSQWRGPYPAEVSDLLIP